MSALEDLVALHEGFASDGSVVYRTAREMGEVLTEQPDLASARATFGVTLLYLGRKAQARDELDAALRLNPRSEPAVTWRVIAERIEGRFESAESIARASLSKNPLFGEVRAVLSDVLADQERFEDAHAELERVFDADSTNVGVVRAMARLHLFQGDVAGARALLEEISADEHPNYRVQLAWALLLACEGERDAARAVLDADTLRYAGTALFAQVEVAEILALAGRRAKALEWVERAVRCGDVRTEWFGRDAFLASMRDEPRFELMTSLRYLS